MRTLFLALAAFLGLAGCLSDGAGPGGPGGPGGDDRVLAVVDGEELPVEPYRLWLSDTYGKPPREDYLDLWLLEREARRRGVVVTQEELEGAREELLEKWVRERCQGDPGLLDAELGRQGHDRGSFRRWFHWQKRRELLAHRLVLLDRGVEPERLKQRFEKLYGPGGVRTGVRLLVLTRARLSLELSRESNRPTPTAAELDELLLARAESLRARAAAGESFENLIRAESSDLSVVKTGGLCRDEEWRLRGAAFVAAVERAPLGGVQAPVITSSGIDLFEVVSRVKTEFDDVQESLAAEHASQAPSLDEVAALALRLRTAARIEFPVN
jgi:hypothetical protein